VRGLVGWGGGFGEREEVGMMGENDWVKGESFGKFPK
jgi:hypothetical protein